MKKMFGKIISVCVSLAMAISIMALNASAEEEVLHGLSKTPPIVEYGGISAYDNN